MLTPYQFASNCPIEGVDLDGLEFAKSTTFDAVQGSRTITFNITIKVVTSDDVKATPFEIHSLLGAAETKIEEKYSTYDQGRDITYITNVNFVQVSSQEIDKEKDFYMELTSGDGGLDKIAGESTKGIGAYKSNKLPIVVQVDGSSMLNSQQTFDETIQTILHELGHAGGLDHVFLAGFNNPPYITYLFKAGALKDNVMNYDEFRFTSEDIANGVPAITPTDNVIPEQLGIWDLIIPNGENQNGATNQVQPLRTSNNQQ
jgi:hypothetical protein